MKYKLIMTAALALSAVLVASVGFAVATDAPWERAQEGARDGIQQQDRDRLSRPEDAGSASAAESTVACGDNLRLRSRVESGTPTRSRAASGTPAACGAVGLTRAQERAATQAQPVLARVSERVEAREAEKAAGVTARKRVRAVVAQPQPEAQPDNAGVDCPDPGQNCPDPDCPGDGGQQREQPRR